eukprot:761566-Pelagomonas_calceolata.AAC.3
MLYGRCEGDEGHDHVHQRLRIHVGPHARQLLGENEVVAHAGGQISSLSAGKLMSKGEWDKVIEGGEWHAGA